MKIQEILSKDTLKLIKHTIFRYAHEKKNKKRKCSQINAHK
jgi:hypothetical protein